MGKKNKGIVSGLFGPGYIENTSNDTCPISEEGRKRMADSLENYLEMFTAILIPENLTPDEYEKLIKKMKKLISNLRKGKNLDKIFDEDEIYMYMESDPDFVRKYVKPEYQ